MKATSEILIDPTILREYDIRGVVGKTLFPETVYTLGRCFGSFVLEKVGNLGSVVVAYDGRLSSPKLADNLIDGLLMSGIDVIDLGVGPTPMLYFGGYYLNASAGMMITGSHNPPEYNGIKIVFNNRPFYGEQIKDLAERGTNTDYEERPEGVLQKVDIKQQYVDRLLEGNQFEGGIRVAWDPGNGSSGEILGNLISKLGGEHFLINGDIDGSFPNHHPDPTVEDNLKQLKELVSKHKCNLGIGLDGDGDRIGVVDSMGRVLNGDQLMIIWARDVLSRIPGSTIISEVKASRSLFDEISKFGGQPLMWKTGHSLIKSKMAELEAPLAGEMSGHIFFADEYYGFDDAIYAALRLLRILADGNQDLSAIRDKLPFFYNTPEIRIECSDDYKFKVIELIKKKLLSDANLKFCDIDGIRVETENGWWLLRASNTQPVLVARCESVTEEGLHTLKKQLCEYLLGTNVNTSILD